MGLEMFVVESPSHSQVTNRVVTTDQLRTIGWQVCDSLNSGIPDEGAQGMLEDASANCK